jgi:hypothetical protein
MGCGSVKTIEHEEKQIKVKINESQNDIQNENQKENKNKNKRVDLIEFANKESTVSSKKFVRQAFNTSRNLEMTKSSKASSRKYRRIEGDYTTVISAIQDSLPEVIAKLDKTEDEIGKRYYEFEVEANRYEIIYPIWLIKDEEVEFYVEGKWKINKEKECDCKGIENQNVILFPEKINEYLNSQEKKYNDGALIGRTIKGNYFLIYDGLKYTPEQSGALLLKMNLNNFWSKEKPEGKLKVKIYGAFKIDNIDDLEKRNGWWAQLKNIEYINEFELEYYEMNNIEKGLIILLNKLRHDSCTFAKQYLDNFQKLTKTSNQIYSQFINNRNQFTPLKVNLTMVKLLQTFFEKIFYKEETEEEDWHYVQSSENCLQEFLRESFYKKKKIHACIVRYYDENIMHVFSRLLFRKEIRDNLLTYEYEEMSMITLFNNWNKVYDEGKNVNKTKNIYYCIFALSNQFGNEKINYNVDKSFEKFLKEEKIKKTLNLVNRSILSK